MDMQKVNSSGVTSTLEYGRTESGVQRETFYHARPFCPIQNGARFLMAHNTKLTAEKFIEKAQRVHANKYDYSRVVYERAHQKVIIICPDHGEFYQTPNSHARSTGGSGCPQCGGMGFSTEERFYAKVDKSGGPDACWIWTGYRNHHGYAKIQMGKRSEFAHRISWELHYGKIPEHDSYHGMCVLHKCDNGAGGCVRPDHLFLGTQTDNIADMDAKGRHASLLGETNPNSVLTWSDVDEMRRLYEAGKMSAPSIAKMYGVSRTHIHRIIKGKSWKR